MANDSMVPETRVLAIASHVSYTCSVKPSVRMADALLRSSMGESQKLLKAGNPMRVGPDSVQTCG